MNFEILHKGKNIESLIDIAECFSVDRYGGMLDDLSFTFPTQSLPVSFSEGDTLEIKTAGGLTTGVMYLDSCNDRYGNTNIKALSCRHINKRKKSRIWNKVKLSKIATDVASNLGLNLVLYGFNDYTYAGVAQIMETDLQLLARLCKREGYSIKCDNGNLIVFNEYYLEHNSKPISISKEDVKSDYSFNRSVNGLSRMTVRYYNPETKQDLSYTHTDDSIPGGEDIRIESLADMSEAHRVTKGYLRDANKYHITGILGMPFNGGISAGTVCDLTGFEDFDGRYVVYEAVHDYLSEKTAIKVRKLLDY